MAMAEQGTPIAQRAWRTSMLCFCSTLRSEVIKPPTPEPEPDLMGSPAVSGALVGLAFKLPLSALSFFIV
ncbi:unnamed protein product [Prorocentrum cordatum]|uniref:Uncharacterized protein n=1 Tax=Prorocentrum cordatum TaxID=2364126 RepID=A0ABN9WRK6_9DINO|nr:unnamed protein product [Polarella glacialis]